jgi:hypothetical protein
LAGLNGRFRPDPQANAQRDGVDGIDESAGMRENSSRSEY